MCNSQKTINTSFLLLILFLEREVGSQSCCPPISIYNTVAKGIAATCKYDGYTKDCHDASLPVGTKLYFTCKSHYLPASEDVTLSAPQPMTCRPNGEWSRYIAFSGYKCQIGCGAPRLPIVDPFILGGTPTSREHWPWHGIIFAFDEKRQTYMYICGGTLVGPLSFITAAHCVEAQGQRVENLQIVLGANSSRLDLNARDPNSKIVKVAYIDINGRYKGLTEGSFHGDIAIITFDEYVEFTDYIAPICLPPEHNPPRVALIEGDVIGFGINDPRIIGGNERPSYRLIHTKLPLVDHGYCRHPRFDYQTQICAGYADRAVGTCRGDSGGGFTFYQNFSGTNKSYLYGIVSAGQPNCRGPSVFTSVQGFIPWIEDIINSRMDDYFANRRPSSVSTDDCNSYPTLPTPKPINNRSRSRSPPRSTTTTTENYFPSCEDEYCEDPVTPKPVPEMRRDIINYINAYRKKHGAPPVSLNRRMVQDAQNLVEDVVRRNGALAPSGNTVYGQILFELTISGRDALDEEITRGAVEKWYDSKKEYDPNNPSPLAFTQLVWKASRSVGIGIETQNRRTIVVCYFRPAGNLEVANSDDRWREYRRNVQP